MGHVHIFIPHGRHGGGSGDPARTLSALGAVLTVILMLGALVYWFRWTAPPAYAPSSRHTLAADISSEIHDARVSAIGDAPYLLNITTPKGALLFFGARHTNDPDDPQITELRAAWSRFKPTAALVEGRMGFFAGTTGMGIRQFGESGAAYALASEAGIPCYTLEPPYEREVEALLELGSPQRVALFLTLRAAMSDRRSGHVSDEQARNLLRRRTKTPALKGAFGSFADLEAFYTSEFPGLPPWRELPEEAMWPSPPGSSGTWLNAMARRSSAVRDEHFAQVLLDLAGKGERVFAVAGRSHVVMLEPALWQSLQPATRGELSSPRPWEE